MGAARVLRLGPGWDARALAGTGLAFLLVLT